MKNLSDSKVQEKYKQWMRENLADRNLRSKCREITAEMKEAFPELERVKGVVYIPLIRNEPIMHWWLRTEDGTIVDPTAGQWVAHIEQYKEIKGNVTGKCPNCGGFTYDNRTVCSSKCSEEYIEYINSH